MVTFAQRPMLSAEEIESILHDLLKIYNIDFFFYSRDSFDRRINRLFKLEKFTDLASFKSKLFGDDKYAEHFVDRITVNVTEMFRDPSFFLSLRNDVIPVLSDLPKIRIWHPGCSTGEEVLSVAILMHEAGLLHKCEFTGTDLNARVLEKAVQAVYPQALQTVYEKNYSESGGTADFSRYYTITAGGLSFERSLLRQTKFVLHNLAADRQASKFDLIVCRNVLIYFGTEALAKTFRLFDECTTPLSYLALGEKETLQFSPVNKKFRKIEPEKIWKKTG